MLVNDAEKELVVVFLESLLFYGPLEVSSFMLMFESPRRRLGLTHLLGEVCFIFVTVYFSLDSCYNLS